MKLITTDLRSTKSTEHEVSVDNLLELMRVVRTKNRMGIKPTTRLVFAGMKTKRAGKISPDLEKWSEEWKRYSVSSMLMGEKEVIFKMKPSVAELKRLNGESK